MRFLLLWISIAAMAQSQAVIDPADLSLGRQLPNFTYTDLTGKVHQLDEVKQRHGVVFATTSATCPISKKQLPSLIALASQLADRGVDLFFLNPMRSETATEIAEQWQQAGGQSPYIHEADQHTAKILNPRSTTEVFFIDSTRTLRYRGALNDQYGVNYSLNQPRHAYLLAAIDAVLKGQKPNPSFTDPVGCELDFTPQTATEKTALTYHRDIARILQDHCVDCHRTDGIAPFPLDAYKKVIERAKALRRVITNQQMPPWFAARDPHTARSPWTNDCSLGERDKNDLLTWLNDPEHPEGDIADAPLPRHYEGQWTIGKPDAIFPLSRAYDIKATGTMPYQTDVIETTFKEDRWVQGYEILPSARGVVHHVIVRMHPPGAKVQAGGAEDYWAAYVPGNSSHLYPEGFARKLVAGAKLSFQIHYTPNGHALKERLQLGLLFAPQPPKFEMRTIGVPKVTLNIPPQEANHVETITRPIPFDLPVTALMAHMHVRGKAFKFELISPDGKTETLLDIPHYDFNWQLRYDYQEPHTLPRGSKLKLTAVFDNSSNNPANPDPQKIVRWGDQTYDEMMIGYLEYFVPHTR
jgi:Redoxin/Copper type II ascorbate-dependent monooxygenase, C-terminal domain